MYKSPIGIIYGEMKTQMEDLILKAVSKVDVDVDKEELTKALLYDRGQYEKGYQDAMANQKWTPVTEWLPEEDTRVLVYLRVEIYDHTHMDTDRLHKNRWVRWGEDVTHWMYLPGPPEGE